MASSYTDLGTELMTTGENAGTWGSTTNTNLQIIEEAIRGYVAVSANSDQTLSLTDGSTGDSIRNAVIAFTGTLSANRTITVPAVEKWWIMDNQTAGAYTLTVKVSGQTGITWGASDKGTKILYGNGTDVVDTNVGGGVGGYDLNGEELILDADANTSITADTDNQIDIKIAGADDFQFTANTFTAQAGSTIAAQALTATTVTASGIVKTDDTTEATTTTDGSLQTDGGLSIAKDAVFGDDVKLLSDSAVLSFGADSDTTLTHTDGTGLTLNSTNKLLFRDTGLYINSSTDGQLDLVADTEIQIAATTIDINGAIAMDGAITGATNITLSGELDSATLDVSGNADIDGTTNLDAVDIDGAVQIDATFTSGVDGQGYDTKFFGDTSSAYMLWDTSADDLVFAGAAGIDLAGDIDVDGTANLDAVDIDGAVQIDGAVTVGVDGTGLDVKFFGDTAGSFLLWDQSDDALELTDSSPIKIGDAADMQIYHDGSNSYITNSQGALKVATETSGIAITIGHTTSEVTVADNLTVTGTLTLGSNAELTEAELEMLDGITAGTVAASKAVVVDSNKDAASFRNVTLTGELDAATGDFSGDVDVDGTLEADAITIGSTAIGSIYGVVAGSSSIVTTGALDSGSITSGFGAIDNGTSNIRSATITAETAFVPDASGGADLGTTALEFNDLFLNDSGSIQFGDDQDTTLTHTDGTGLTLNSTNKLCFNDASQFVQGSSNAILSIGATDEIDLTATAIDINGTCDISGTFSLAGTNVTSTAAEINYSDLATLGTSAASKVLSADANNLTKITGGVYLEEDTLSFDATQDWDVRASPVAAVVLTANVTFDAPSNPTTGQYISILCVQDGTGSRTIAWNAVFEFTGGTAPTATTTAGKGDLFTFRYHNSHWVEVGRNLNLTRA